MSLDEFIRVKQEQLRHLEERVEQRAHVTGDKLGKELEAFRSKRDDLLARLRALRGETKERIDVLRMGIESAWRELKTAFEMATRELPPHAAK